MATITICDVCKTDKNVSRCEYTTGVRAYNGVDYDEESKIIDLCPSCEVRLLRSAVTGIITNKKLGTVTEARFLLNCELIKAYNHVVKTVR
jgi:hypothetical protein